MAQAGKDPEPYLHWLLPSSSLCVGCWINSSRRILKPLYPTDSSALKRRVRKLLLENTAKRFFWPNKSAGRGKKKNTAVVVIVKQFETQPLYLLPGTDVLIQAIWYSKILVDAKISLRSFKRYLSSGLCNITPYQAEEVKPSAMAKLFSCSIRMPLIL